jgi:hypothetical protein
MQPIKINFKRKTRKETKMKFYKMMALPLMFYGSEGWTVKKEDKTRIRSFLQSVRGCTIMDTIRNENIRKELEIFSTDKKRTEYKIR